MFPEFNIRSTPLLVLVIQGLIFAALLFYRYRSKKKDAYLLIALILLVMAYARTTYTIGFMGWYDAFKNTKINYYLWPMGLAMAPLIYLYVRTTIKHPFKLTRKDLWHFLPFGIFVLGKLTILFHDMSGDDWEQGYSSGWKAAYEDVYVDAIMTHVIYTVQVLYLAFTLQLYLSYRQKIKHFFSNTYNVELNWIRNFLAVYIILFVYGAITNIIDAYIIELDYVHKWWLQLFSAIAIVYLCIKAYITDIDGLHGLTFGMTDEVQKNIKKDPERYAMALSKISSCLEENETYLNPDITLRDLASASKLSTHEVSEAINSGYGINFNELINRYRVDKVKKELLDTDKDHLSLVAIAHDCGFNSKATFNRVFKKVTGTSPSEYRNTHKK